MKRDIHDYFNKYDSNGDGYLSVDEVEQFLKEASSKRGKDLQDFREEAKHFMARIDKNTDMQVSKEEFYQFYIKAI